MPHFRLLAVAIPALALASAAGAQEPSTGQPADAFDRVMACRGMSNSEARLACYDTAVGAFDTARRQGDVVVVDRAQTEAARRRLFGFQAPSLPFLGGSDDGQRIAAIETTLVSARQSRDGAWTFHLADDSVWRQVDSERPNFPNRAGQPVRIRQAAMGSYLLSVGGARSVRARRQ